MSVDVDPDSSSGAVPVGRLRVPVPDPAEPWTGRSWSLGYQVNHLAQLMATLLSAEIAEHGVVPGQFRAAPGPL